MANNRSYDVVVFGATGFTGRLAAEYLARRPAGTPVRWAIAGRNTERLAEIKQSLVAIDPACEHVGVLQASVDDPASLARMARTTRVVLTTVGPFVRYGEPVVAACVAAGADYVDITGEPDYVDEIIARFDAPARAAGVRVVSCCGFDSIPHDLGVWLTVRELPRDQPLRVEGFVRARGTLSGGTWQSAIDAMAKLRQPRTSPRRTVTNGRRVHGIRPRVRYDRALGAWVCPLPTIDPQVVLRSAAALDEYGPDFSYGHYARVRSTAWLVGGALGVGAIATLAQFGPTRDLLRKVRQPGEGPDAAARARAWFNVTIRGEGGGRQVVTEVAGRDPGYDETAKMASEAALCLALDRDRLPQRAGVLTPATAMGDALLARLREAGIRFEVVERR